ncbi:MAG: methyltransferase [Alphaproteobacteria bacterium]
MFALERFGSFRAVVGRNGSTLACGLFVLAVLLSVLLSVLLGAALEHSLPRAVWLLSFWHYYLYWLAAAFGVPSFDVFKRDAVAMKTVSVAVLASAYLAAPLDLASLAVIAAGIGLNIRAASVLGVDRTYYGHEVAGLPPRRITAFPYSLVAHPMILGNVAAFGGTLINPAFAQRWWLLVCLHVALNIGLLVMELMGRGRTVRIGGGLVFASVLFGVVYAAPIALGAVAIACAWILYRCYAPETLRRNS